MKYKKKVLKHIEETFSISKTLCDICGKKIENDGHFDASEVTIEAKIGNCWPDGDCRDWFTIDVCPYCFTEKIIPLIEKTFNTKFRNPDIEDYSQLNNALEEKE